MAVSMSLTIFNEFWFIYPKVCERLSRTGINDHQSLKVSLRSFFLTAMAPTVALIWPFVEFSVIQLSLVLSYYLRHLRVQIDRWPSMDSVAKERLRQIYWSAQCLIKER